MDDEWEHPGDGGDGLSAPPGTGPEHKPGPETMPVSVLEDFGRWLDGWAGYVRARLAVQGGRPLGGAPARGSPPAHWLALFSDQSVKTAGEQVEVPQDTSSQVPEEVIHQFEADLTGFLGHYAPAPAAVESMDQIERGSEFEGTSGWPSRQSQQPVNTHREPNLPAAQPASQAASHVTQLRVRTRGTRARAVSLLENPQAEGGMSPRALNYLGVSQHSPIPVHQSEKSAGQPGMIQLRVNRSSEKEKSERSSSLVHSGQEAFSQEGSQIEMPDQRETGTSKLVGTPEQMQETGPAAGYSVSEESPPSLQADEPGAAVLHWPERYHPFDPVPIRWPSEMAESGWPDLPDANPLYDPGQHPHQDIDRRRRIDREQGGPLWKG